MKEFSIGCLAAIILIFFESLIYFAAGYLDGLILKWIIGGTVVNGLNLLFNTTRFTADTIPITCGALALMCSFFKSSITTKKD